MKNKLLILSFVLMMLFGTLTTFAAGNVLYPNWSTYNKMITNYPDDLDGHFIFATVENRYLLSWDTENTEIEISENYQNSGSDYLDISGKSVFRYKWDWNNEIWLFDKSFTGHTFVPCDGEVYSSININSFANSNKTIYVGGERTKVYQYALDTDRSLGYTTFAVLFYDKGFTGSWFSENSLVDILYLIPLLLVVVVGFIAIRKGISFIRNFMRSA